MNTRWGKGNQNGAHPPRTVKLHREVLYPEFEKAGRMPFSFGCVYSDEEDLLETVKENAGDVWPEPSKSIYREVHSVRDAGSPHLVDTVPQWGNHPIRVAYSADGVRPRPTAEEFRSVLKYIFDNVRTLEIPVPTDTKQKFIFELFGDENSSQASADILAEGSEAYREQFGTYPENFDKYPDDWKDPAPPPLVKRTVCSISKKTPGPYCPETIEITVPAGTPDPGPCDVHQAPPEPPRCYEKYIADRPIWKWQLGRFIACILGKD